MTAAVLERHYTCALCDFDIPIARDGHATELCPECRRGRLGATATDLAQRLVDASGWQQREARLADLTLRHRAVVAVLEAAMRTKVTDVSRLHLALIRELTAPLRWRGPGYERALFLDALGRGPMP